MSDTDHRIIIVCPTRSRPKFASQLAQSFLDRPHSHSRLVLVVPQEQSELYPEIPGVEILHHPLPGITGIVPPANVFAKTLSQQCDTLSVTGDDSLFRTDDWEARVIESRQSHWLCYTNDLHQFNRLIGNYFVDSRVINALGWFWPPCFCQLYADNAWGEICKRIGNIEYLSDVVIEHIHPNAGKRPMDELTAAMNSADKYSESAAIFERYMSSDFNGDVSIVENCLNDYGSLQ